MEQQMTRGLRNNNPGNIEKSKDNWVGMSQAQPDDRFVTFTHMKYGYRAMFRIINTFYTKYGLNTIREVIHRWAPPVENNTEAYVSRVSKTANYPANVTFSLKDKQLMCNIVAGMDIVENSNGKSPRKPNMKDIEEGYDLAFNK